MTDGQPFELPGKRIWIAGHRGMVGRAMVTELRARGADVLTVGREKVDLVRQDDVERWMNASRPDAIVIAAARVGGILANDTYPADFLYDNLMIEANIIQAAFRNKVGKLLFLGSSCIYPKMAPQPITEEALLTGPLEPTNEWYAIAKIAGIKLCQAYRRQHGCDFISAMPTNLYGPHDNFDLDSSHVIPALMRKAHEAKLRGDKTMTIWGSGTPRREFLHVADAAGAMVRLLESYSGDSQVNVGSGSDVTITELAKMVMEVVGFEGELVHDTARPDGTPRKLMDVTRLKNMGWSPHYSLREGLSHTYGWFVEHVERGEARV